MIRLRQFAACYVVWMAACSRGAPARGRPEPQRADLGSERFTETQDGVTIETVLVRRFDVKDCRTRAKPQARSHVCNVNERAGAGPRRATITWRWTSECDGSRVPKVHLDGRSIQVGVDEDATGCGGQIASEFRTTLGNLAPGRYRIAGQGSFDRMLDVPEHWNPPAYGRGR
jgi:hypothetical protein